MTDEGQKSVQTCDMKRCSSASTPLSSLTAINPSHKLCSVFQKQKTAQLPILKCRVHALFGANGPVSIFHITSRTVEGGVPHT